MRKLIKTLLIVVLFGLFLVNQHLMDISHNSMEIYRITLNDQLLCDMDVSDDGTTNGFWWNNNSQLYHITWYMNYVIIFIYTIVCLKCIVK